MNFCIFEVYVILSNCLMVGANGKSNNIFGAYIYTIRKISWPKLGYIKLTSLERSLQN